MTKAMLRSPEIALSAVGSILASMFLNLSVYMSDQSKMFLTNLRSKEENTREDEIEGTLALGRQCSIQSRSSVLDLVAPFRTNTLSSAVPLIPSLSKVVDNAVKQSAQVAIVSEAVHAAACLVKIAGVDLATEQSLAELLTLVVDTEKCMFYQEKFLAGAGAAALQSLTSLITTLLISHMDKVGSIPTPMMRSLVISMMSNVQCLLCQKTCWSTLPPD
eukprot:GFUD01039967.1.p1 GENE.GFUD01039967.1~~GFUD01039967.1.p1  ORF type:complete len:218 (-),score=69.56 GFUD01039967.1:239-892(-)